MTISQTATSKNATNDSLSAALSIRGRGHLLSTILLLVAACGGSEPTGEVRHDEFQTFAVEHGEDFVASRLDFSCLHDAVKVGRTYVWNVLGYLDEAVDVANSPSGGTYPVGTILSLVPEEAMVKRGEGYSPSTNDWEFFALEASSEGTRIKNRGPAAEGIVGRCVDCHSKADAQFDFTCGTGRGCDDTNFAEQAIFDFLAATDPRCGG